MICPLLAFKFSQHLNTGHASQCESITLAAALFQKEIFQMSTVLENIELNTASNG